MGHSVSEILRKEPTKLHPTTTSPRRNPLSQTSNPALPLCPRVVYPHTEPLHGPRYQPILYRSPPTPKETSISSPVAPHMHFPVRPTQGGPITAKHYPESSLPGRMYPGLRYSPYLLPHYPLGFSSILPHTYPLYSDRLPPHPHLPLSPHISPHLPFEGYPHFSRFSANGHKDLQLALTTSHKDLSLANGGRDPPLALTNSNKDLTVSPTGTEHKDRRDLVPLGKNYLKNRTVTPTDNLRDLKHSPTSTCEDPSLPATSSASSMATSLRGASSPFAPREGSPPVGMAASSDCLPSKPTSALLSSSPEEAVDLRKARRGRIIGYKTLSYPLTRQNGKIRYDCNVCGKTFGQLSNLKVIPPSYHHRTPVYVTVVLHKYMTE